MSYSNLFYLYSLCINLIHISQPTWLFILILHYTLKFTYTGYKDIVCFVKWSAASISLLFCCCVCTSIANYLFYYNKYYKLYIFNLLLLLLVLSMEHKDL